MFTVLVQGSNGQWRSTTEETLSACVMLTLGLTCRFRICKHGNIAIARLDCGSIVNVGNTALLPKYYHALRSLICRWINRQTKLLNLGEDSKQDLRYYFRLTDLDLLKAIRNCKEYINLIVDPFAVDSNPEASNDDTDKPTMQTVVNIVRSQQPTEVW